MADLRSAPFDKGNYFGLVATMLSKLYAQKRKRELSGSLFFCARFSAIVGIIGKIIRKFALDSSALNHYLCSELKLIIL